MELIAARLSTTIQDGERRFRLIADGLRLRAGEIMAITGESGSGKTLLLEVIALLRRPDPAADFNLDLGDQSVDLAALWATESSRREINAVRGALFGFVPQTGALLPYLSARENIALSQEIAGVRDPSLVDDLIGRLGLGDVARQLPAKLSIGQRQRVAIARALSHRPSVIIADEPTASLDPEVSREVLALLLELAREEGRAVLLSSHDLTLLDTFDLGRATVRVSRAEDGALMEARLEMSEKVAA